MVIAVNTRFLAGGELEGVGNFIQETFLRITRMHPEHEFIFIYDRPDDNPFLWGSNVKKIVTGPPARHPILWKWWFDFRIPPVLKKYNADVFVSCDGFCSLRTNVPQCIVVHDLAFLHHPYFIKKSQYRFYKKYTPRFLRKSSSVATVSKFSKHDIVDEYDIPADKIDVVYNGVKEIFKPVTNEEKDLVKNKYTSGRDFFLYAGAIHPRKNLRTLLRAFSIFKKRQQSSMKLVLAGRLAWKFDSFVKDLENYKYRDDVVMTGYVNDDELATIMASAYCLVYPSLLEGFGVPVLEAMRCGVPVITSVNSAMMEIAGKAALYADPKSTPTLAQI